MFVTFEGPDGSGKTTQIRLLERLLSQRGYRVLLTREPGGTEIGNAIRTLLLREQHGESMSDRAEALLFNAARAQLVDQVICPALARGEIILCDRFADSTLAYQGYGREQELDDLRMLIRFATGGLNPDLTCYLDIEPEEGLRRKLADQKAEWNRLDAETLAFHQIVRKGYLALAEEEPERWLIIDATLDLHIIQRRIAQRIEILIERYDRMHSSPKHTNPTDSVDPDFRGEGVL
ncbi:dTMP kinase [Chloroflexi bacterium TSY]|nr:dTMP kinase [Chloroflexi bacterium TSY]